MRGQSFDARAGAGVATRGYGSAVAPENQLYFANWALVTQIVGAAAAVLSVGIAAVFGVLTLRTTRIAQDANQRANIAATTTPSGTAYQTGAALSGEGTLSATGSVGPPRSTVSWSVAQTSIEEWSLTNGGPGTAYRVRLSGLTDRDDARIGAPWNPDDSHTVIPHSPVGFQFARRLGASGPGTLVAEWTDSLDSTDTQTARLAVSPQ